MPLDRDESYQRLVRVYIDGLSREARQSWTGPVTHG
jgi:hypothetical protein